MNEYKEIGLACIQLENTLHAGLEELNNAHQLLGKQRSEERRVGKECPV